MNTLMNIFLWFSNTDPEIYKMCKSSVRWQRQSLSLFVLITGLFAFITGSYFVSTLFTTYDEAEKVINISTQGLIISTFMGAIWMMFIINLDKTIISTSNKWKAFVRIPLAILIGFAISAPLEIQLFSKKITKSLIESSRIENKMYEERYINSVSDIDKEIKNYKATIAAEKTEISKWRDIMEAETVGRVKAGRTGLAGQGPAYKEALENYELHKSYLNEATTSLAALLGESTKEKTGALTEYKQQKIDQTFDFASQYEQLYRMIQDPKNRNLKHLAYAIIILFILIELTPALMKISAENDTYDNLLKARTVQEAQAISVLANHNNSEVQSKGAAIISGPDEIYQPKISFPQIGAIIS